MKRNCWSNVRDIDENPYCDVPFLLLVYAEHPEFAILNASMVGYLLEVCAPRDGTIASNKEQA